MMVFTVRLSAPACALAGMLLGACAAPPPPTAAPSPPRVAAPPPVTPDPQPTPPEPAKPSAEQHLPGYSILASTPWPGASGFDDVLAVIAQPPGVSNPTQRVLTWYRTSDTAPAPRSHEYPLGPVEVTSLVAFDVNGDGRNELVVFARDGAHVAKTLEVFELPPDRYQPLDLTREAAALDGAGDAEAVRKLLPLTRGLPKDDIASATPTALIGRASFASLEQFRALIGPKGLELCNDVAQNYQNSQRKCRRLGAKQITAKIFDTDIKHLFENALESTLILAFECGDNSCIVGQPSGYEKQFEFSGTGAARRLTRIIEVDHGIGE
jgi:hypothetical protein